MPRKKPPEDTRQASVRLPVSLLDALDEEVAEQQAAQPTRPFTRSNLIHEIVDAHVKQRRARKRPRGTKHE